MVQQCLTHTHTHAYKQLEYCPGTKIRQTFPARTTCLFVCCQQSLACQQLHLWLPGSHIDQEVTNWYVSPSVTTNLLNEVLHFILQAPPLEFDSDQFVGTHVWAVFLGKKLLLQVQKYAQNKGSFELISTTKNYKCFDFTILFSVKLNLNFFGFSGLSLQNQQLHL